MAYDALVERNISIPRSEVFASLYDFGGIKKILPDAIGSCECVGEGVGAVRTIALADGSGTVVERMDIAHDETVFGYSITENNALPVENYVAIVTLSDIQDGGTHISWGSNWSTTGGAPEEEVQGSLEGLYGAIIDGMVAAK
jgi:hypothetical protein